MGMEIVGTSLAGVLVVQPKVFLDSRGFFKELYQQEEFQRLGLESQYFQDNFSKSCQNTVRGLHFQRPPFAQGKLVTVLDGVVLDVVVDLRPASSTYGKHYSILLSSENHSMLYIPPGFAHGFSVLSPSCLFYYKCTQRYDRASDGGIRWDDPSLGIDWRVESPVVSEKDLQLPLLRDFISPF